jgi:hypothetical protein
MLLLFGLTLVSGSIGVGDKVGDLAVVTHRVDKFSLHVLHLAESCPD